MTDNCTQSAPPNCTSIVDKVAALLSWPMYVRFSLLLEFLPREDVAKTGIVMFKAQKLECPYCQEPYFQMKAREREQKSNAKPPTAPPTPPYRRRLELMRNVYNEDPWSPGSPESREDLTLCLSPSAVLGLSSLIPSKTRLTHALPCNLCRTLCPLLALLTLAASFSLCFFTAFLLDSVLGLLFYCSVIYVCCLVSGARVDTV